MCVYIYIEMYMYEILIIEENNVIGDVSNGVLLNDVCMFKKLSLSFIMWDLCYGVFIVRWIEWFWYFLSKFKLNRIFSSKCKWNFIELIINMRGNF